MFLIVVSEGGLIQDVIQFDSRQKAEEEADSIAEGMDPEADDVIVWDLEKKSRVYQPLAEDEDEDEEEDEEEDEPTGS